MSDISEFEKMYDEFLDSSKTNNEKGNYTHSESAKKFKEELMQERLAFEVELQELKKREEEHQKDVHFRKWQEGLVEDKELDEKYNIFS